MTPQATERLIFRELTDDDIAAIHAYASDPEVCKFMIWGPNSPEDTRNFIAASMEEQRANPRTDWTLGIIRKSDAQLVGVCSFHVECFVNRAASLGYALRREEWGRGYASEAVKAMLDFGFGSLGMHRIWATCRPDNIGSANVLRRVGMQHEGRLRHHVLLRKEWRDSLLFAVLANE